VIDSCNQQAQAQSGASRDKKGKLIEVGKDVGIGALGGGLVGAGGGTLYGIWDNKKHDEFFRDAYARCMKAKGYTA